MTFFTFQYQIQFDSDGTFYLEENAKTSSLENTVNDVTSDTNYNGSKIYDSVSHTPPELYRACIKAHFQGTVNFDSQENWKFLNDNQIEGDVKLHNQIESSSTNGCKLSVATMTDNCKLSPSQPHTLKEKKHISTSTGFLKEISDTQKDLDTVNKSGSSKSVNSSDIKSKCDFRVATACFSNIKCLNPSIQNIRKISKENVNSNGIPAETSSLVSSNETETQLNIKVNTEKVEQWLTQVLSLLNKEYIISSTSTFKIVLPLRNKLSSTLIDPIDAELSNAMSTKKFDISLQKYEDTSMKKVSHYFYLLCYFDQLPILL